MQNAIDRFRLELSASDRKWFEGSWRDFDGAASLYNQSLDPSETLGQARAVWGGMMLPDTIPLLANGFGDYLCARFTNDGRLSEIIEWFHEGVGWRHYGYSINQAITLDQMEYSRRNSSGEPQDSHPSAELSSVAISEDACKQAVRSQLEDACRRVGGAKLAKLAGVSWSELKIWLQDPSGMPLTECAQIAAALGLDQAEMIHQDWDAALLQSQSVLKVRADLAWPYAVAGQAFERLKCPDDAIEMYKAGVTKLGSSSSFTAHWSTASSARTGKFAADRLLALDSNNLESTVREYVKALINRKVRQYWFASADTAAKKGDHRGAYQCLFAAGWDIYYSNDILEILQALKTAAKLAGSHTLEAIATLHIDSMK